MTPQDATRSVSSPAYRFRLPLCPRCGDTLLAPEEAAHVRGSLVRNSWSCEGCGHAFETSVSFSSQHRCKTVPMS